MARSVSKLDQEIQQQPTVLAQILAKERARAQRLAVAIDAFAPHHIVFVARGSADNAARYGKYLFSALNGMVVGMRCHLWSRVTKLARI
jgi:fructoselysine-6-P-deglycase FrlB-like protein